VWARHQLAKGGAAESSVKLLPDAAATVPVKMAVREPPESSAMFASLSLPSPAFRV